MVEFQRDPLRACNKNIVQGKFSHLAEIECDIIREASEQAQGAQEPVGLGWFCPVYSPPLYPWSCGGPHSGLVFDAVSTYLL